MDHNPLSLPDDLVHRPLLADRMTQAITFLRTSNDDRGLTHLADHVGMSLSHVQRTFAEWVGISPKRFEQHLQKDRALAALQRSANVLNATFEAGVSSPGRLHDLLITCEAITPGEVRSGGLGLVWHHGMAQSPLGPMWVVGNERGVHRVEFVLEPNTDAEQRLRLAWPQASLVKDDAFAQNMVDRCFRVRPASAPLTRPLHLLLRGTNFQLKVWEALLAIPSGEVCTYQDVARHAGHPTAMRAVGTAVGMNPVAMLIPCHRVIRANGDWGHYHWGVERKQALLAWETECAELERPPHHQAAAL